MTKLHLRERPTKEQIALLPPFVGLALKQIVVLRTTGQLDDAFRSITREKLVGFDTETKPTFTKGAKATGPHIVQFALRSRAFIVRLGRDIPLPFLKAVLESQEIVKVGFGLKSDRGALTRRLGINVRAAVDLAGTLRALRYKQTLGAKAAVAIVLGRQLQKSKSVTKSNWAHPELTPKQLLYAADDAYAALCVYRAFKNLIPAGVAYNSSPAGVKATACSSTDERRVSI